MTDASIRNREHRHSSGRIPTDDQMDTLLKQFFRQEVPAALPAATPGSVSLRSESVARPAPVRRQFALVVVATAIAACCLIVAGLRQTSDVGHGTAERQPVTTDPNAEPQILDRATELMPVSPNAGRNSAVKTGVGPGGATMEEIEGVNLNPKN